MELYFVRHGESIGNTKRGFISGRRDPDGLSKKGRTQIIRTTWELKDITFDGIFSSPVHRALETAGILNIFLHKNIRVEDWLTEYDQGIFENHYWWEVVDQVPPGWGDIRENYDVPFPGGESLKSVAHRVVDGFKKFISQLPEEGKFLVVSHNAPLTALLYYLQNDHPDNWMTKEQQKKFTDFMHSNKPANGGIIKIKLKKRKVESIEQKNEFKPLDITESTVEFYLKGFLESEIFPKVEPITTASGNKIYKISNNSNHYLLKIFKAHEFLSISRLVELYNYLEKHTKISAPKAVHYERNKVFFPEAILIQDYMEGVELIDCLKEHPKGVAQLLKQIYEILQNIHNIPTEEVKFFWYPDHWDEKDDTNWQEFIEKETLKTMENTFVMGLNEEEMKKVILILRELIYYIRSKKYEFKPLHGDLSPHNFVVGHESGCNVVKVLDFERVRIGDSWWDYVYFYGWLERVDTDVARQWKELVLKNSSEDQKKVFDWYVILFHAWTVRDMMDYKGDEIRKWRGEQSLEILKKILN